MAVKDVEYIECAFCKTVYTGSFCPPCMDGYHRRKRAAQVDLRRKFEAQEAKRLRQQRGEPEPLTGWKKFLHGLWNDRKAS